MNRLVAYIMLLLLGCPLFAQVATTQAEEDAKPAKQDWFDPTRKQEKKKEVYQFSMDWRIEVGYAQDQHRSLHSNFSNPFLHGIKMGATVDFNLPLHFSMQTGLFYTCAYGRLEQHWSSMSLETQQVEYIRHNYTEHRLALPIRAFYTQNLWRKLNLFFYAGPKFELGIAAPDYLQLHLSDGTLGWLQEQGVPTANYDRYTNELHRLNVQMGLGGGFDWDCYRLQAGYDFGLNNMVKTKVAADAHMWQWGWYVSFAYKF